MSALAKKPRRAKGFGEAQGKFAPVDGLRSLFAAYDFACAFTGQDLTKEAAVDPRGALINLSNDPLSNDATLLIPATLDAAYAFERGHLVVGPRYELFSNLERISPELLEALNPIGRLRLPADPALAPSQAALTPRLIAFLNPRRD